MMTRQHFRIGMILLSAQYLCLDVFPLSTRRIRRSHPLRSASCRMPSAAYSSVDDEDNDDDVDSGDDSHVMASPLSQLPSEDGEGEHLYRGSFTKNERWLEDATDEFLDIEKIPIGALAQSDVQSMIGLMAAWVRRRSVEAALIVEQLLKRVVDDIRAGNPDVHVNARMYTIAIDAWAKSGADGGAERAQNIHNGMIALYKQTGDPLIAPSTISYNAVMNGWARWPGQSAALKAEEVLRDMIEWEGDGIKPDAISFSTVMDAYARSNSAEAIKRAEELFAMMVTLGVRRNVYTFSALQNVYARSGRSDAPVKTLGLLHRMLDLSSNGDVFAKPNCVSYNAVLSAYSRTPSKESTRLAHGMISKMELPVEKGGYDVEPDRLSYALTILACSRCSNLMMGADFAEEVLMKMEARAKLEAQKREEVSSAAPPPVTLDLECFNVVLIALSKSRMPDTVSRSYKIVKRMEQYAKEGQPQVRPTIRSWNAVLNALSRSKGSDVGEKAEKVLNHLFDLHREGVPDCKPDAFSFAAVLSSYQRRGGIGGAQRADEIVRRMEELYEKGDLDKPPDVYHYTIVTTAWARSCHRAASQRCVEIISHMKERHEAGYPGVKPNIRTYNAVLDVFGRSKEAEKAEQLLYHLLALARNGDADSKPDAFSFNAVINAYTRSDVRDAGKRAESVLDRFLEYSEECPEIYPDSRSFTNIIAHYNRCKRLLDAPYRAEYVLNRLVSLYKSGHKRLEPNVFAVTTVMDTYAQHEHPDAGVCAERLLRLLKKLRDDYGVSKLEINTGVICSVLNAWASCGDDNAGNRADALLREMEEKFDAGSVELRPNVRSYCLVLSAWSKSGSPDKAEKAFAVLRRMERRCTEGKMRGRAGEYPHSLVINACAYTSCSPDVEAAAFKIAVDIMTKMAMNDYLSPSSITYGWFFQACGRLRVPDHIREENLERSFNSCCQRGLVTDFVLTQLKRSARAPLLKRLLAPAIRNTRDFDEAKDDIKEKIFISHLPKSWTSRDDGMRRGTSKNFAEAKRF